MIADMNTPGNYIGRIRRKRLIDEWVMLCVGVIIGIALVAFLQHCVPNPRPAVMSGDCRSCHYKMALARYFQRKGSSRPEEMANAIINTKTPRLLAAIAVVESSANPGVRNSGYRKRHHGAFQVNPKYWQAVPHDAAGQALQAERILSELTETMPLKKALKVYGGDSTDRYGNKILAELMEVP